MQDQPSCPTPITEAESLKNGFLDVIVGIREAKERLTAFSERFCGEGLPELKDKPSDHDKQTPSVMHDLKSMKNTINDNLSAIHALICRLENFV